MPNFSIHLRIIHAVIAAILTILVGFFPWTQRRNRQTTLFALSNLCLAIWNMIDLCFIFSEHRLIVFLYRFGLIIGIFTALFFYRFILSFDEYETPLMQKMWHGVIVTGIVLIGLSPTSWLVTIGNSQSPFSENPGVLMPVYVVFFISVLGLAVARFIFQFIRADGLKRNQMSYLSIALLFALTEAVIYFASLYYPIPAYRYYYFQVVYSIIVAYAIISHQLLDINVVIRRTLLYSMITAGLASVYVGTVTVLAEFSEGGHRSKSAFSSALAAIFITLLFNPLRVKVQHWIDRLFPREHFDPILLQEAAGGFAHEMKRPLAKISLPAELALMDLNRLEQGSLTLEEAVPLLRQRLIAIQNQSLDAGTLIETIRSLSVSSTPTLEPTDLKGIIHAAIISHKESLDKNGVTIKMSLPDHLSVLGQARQLEIVFINLIKNAVEAMQKLPSGYERQLRFEAIEENGQFVITVVDTGPGIQPENRNNLFQSYFTTKGSLGMGIGLSLSREIIRAHGGTMTTDVSQDKGARFLIRLPSF